MLDRILNPTRTIHKWDNFWTGFIPAVLGPWIGFLLVYCMVFFYSKFKGNAGFDFNMYLSALRQSSTFLKVSSLSCFGNAALFFFFINKEYFNAARAVVITTMLYIMAILIYQSATS